MAEKILILAKSGSGKSTSLRNLDPKESVCIQVLEKRLPFPKAREWQLWDKDSATGSRIVLNHIDHIKLFMAKAIESGKKIIIIDDLVYIMAKKVMDEVENTDWSKWTYLAKDIYDLFMYMNELPEDIRIYILTHTEEDANGNIKMKTAGKLLDSLVTPEGMFTTVLGMAMKDGKYCFKTNKEHVSEPFKTPMEMFDKVFIENDLKIVDDTIKEYYGIQ